MVNGMAACLLMFRVVFLHSWRISLVCLALELVGSLVELGFSRYGGFWVSSCLLIFPGIRSSLMLSSFGVKPPVFSFQSYSYNNLKTFSKIHHI